MRIAVAPDVFRRPGRDGYLKTLSNLEQERDKHCYIITRELKKQYEIVVGATKRPYNTFQALACRIAGDLATGTSFKRLTIEPEPLSVDRCKGLPDCELTDTDRHLLCIAEALAKAHTPADLGPAVVLVVDCPADLSSRCLCLDSWTAQFCDKAYGVEILSANDSDSIKRLHKEPGNLTNSQQHDARFQDQCTLWLTRRFNCVGRTNVNIPGGDIDCFCETKMDGLRHIYIGECKLIHGMADKIEEHRKAVDQLDKAIRFLVSKGPEQGAVVNMKLECFIFSNVPNDYDPEVKAKAEVIEGKYGTRIHFVRVTMLGKWQNTPAWSLGDERFQEIPL